MNVTYIISLDFVCLCGKRYSDATAAAAHFKTVNSLLQFGKDRVTITTMYALCVLHCVVCVCGMVWSGMVCSRREMSNESEKIWRKSKRQQASERERELALYV